MVIKRWITDAWVKQDLDISIAEIVASGTPDSTTYLRGDGVWSTLSFAAVSHTHGDLTSAGIVQTATPPDIATGDHILIADNSDTDKLKKSSTVFGTTATTFLNNAGDWADPVSRVRTLFFDYETTTSGDPGQGDFRLNNASYSLATILYVDDQVRGADSGYDDIQPLLRRFESGIIEIIDTTTGSAAYYEIEHVTEQTGYFQYTIDYLDMAGAFSLVNGRKYEFRFHCMPLADQYTAGTLKAYWNSGTSTLHLRNDGTDPT